MSLYIGNLSSRTRRDELEHVFQRFGRCDVRIKDGYGFVVYEFPPNAGKALRALRKRQICGEPLTLTWSNKQPRHFNRLSRAGGSYKPQHGKDAVRRGKYVKGKSGSNDQDYRMSVQQSDGVSGRNGFGNMHDKDVMYHDDETKDNFVAGHSSYQQDILDKGGRFEPDEGDNDRWDEQFHDQPDENGIENDVEFERYEPYQDCDRKYDDGFHQMAYYGGSTLQSSLIDSGRDHKDEANLKHPVNAKSRLTCYRCGGSGHKMRNCPQESTSLRKSTRFDCRNVDDINRGGNGGSEPRRFRSSRSRERSSRDSPPKRLPKTNIKSSDLEKLQRSVSSRSSPAQNEIDESWKRQRVGNKRNRKESGSPKRHSTKKARASFSSSLHSRSHSASQSFKHVKRHRSRSQSRSISSRPHSLSSKSRSSSASHSGSKSSKSRARSSSRISLSASVGRPLPSSSNKGQLNLKGSSDNAITPESNVIVAEQGQLVEGGRLLDEKHEHRPVAVISEIGMPIEMEKGQCLEKDNEDCLISSSSLNEITNSRTVGVEKGTVENGNISAKNLDNGIFPSRHPWEMNCENSDKLITEHVPIQLKNPGADPPVSSGPGQSLSFSSDELCVVLKHYYGHDVRSESERHLPVDAYFGSARMWPWEVIYYRRSKKGPISVENYARRIEQNKEFGIVDKYIRSSSGWGENP